jgi:diacylglycerol kinase (ATP)
LTSYIYILNFFQTFQAPSFDDKILEVVAVFGSVQMAVSRVLDIQHHRIAQVHW